MGSVDEEDNKPEPGEVAGSQEAPVSPRRFFRQILEGRETHGDGTAVEQANRYRVDKLLDEIVAAMSKALEATSSDALCPVDMLISLAGFSPETTILASCVFRPKRLFIVSTDEAYENINQIGSLLFSKGVLTPAGFQHERCNPRDPMNVFNIVRRVITDARKRPGGLGRSLVDITGGKKVMSAMAAQAGWEEDLTVCYIDSTQDAKHRVVRPGSENILLLRSPSKLAGHAQLEQAHQLFDLGVYEAALGRYKELVERLAEPATARLMCEVSALYVHWRAFDLAGIPKAIDGVRATLEYPGRFEVPARFLATLEQQLGFLGQLVAGERKAFILGVYALADDYRRRGRFDFSTLLFYRSLEACFAEQLKRSHNVDASAFDRSAIGERAAEVERKFGRLVAEITRDSTAASVPTYIGCFEAFVLLRALDDQMMKDANLWNAKQLINLQSLLVSRNKSILAHGFESVSERACDQLRHHATAVLQAALTLWGQGKLETELHPATFARVGGGS